MIVLRLFLENQSPGMVPLLAEPMKSTVLLLQIPVAGSKAAATVIVEGKKFGDEWGVTLLEIRPENKEEKLSLTADLAARSGVDTPKFDPNAAQPSSPKTALPPAEITIELPPGLPGQE